MSKSFFAKIKIKYVVVVIVIVIVGVIAIMLFKKNHTDKTEASSSADKGTLITVATTKLENVDVYDKSIGTIYNLNSVSISSEVSGIIEKVFVDVGDTIEAGQILASVDQSEIINERRSQQANIKQLEIQVGNQRKTVDRYEALKNDGFISQAEMDAADASLKAYQEQLSAAKGVLANIDRRLSRTDIRSQISGIIQERVATEGNYTAVGSSLFSVIDNSNLIVISNFPESYLGKLKRGQKVLLNPAGISETIHTSVKEIKPMIDQQSRTIQIVIEVGENEFNIKPGGTVDVSVLLENKTDVIMVPEESIVLRAAGKTVYVLQPDSTVKQVLVRTGIMQNGRVEIVEGISENEQIAVLGAGFLDDGLKVTVRDQAASSDDNDDLQISSSVPVYDTTESESEQQQDT